MTSETPGLRLGSQFTFDGRALALVAIMLATQLAAVALIAIADVAALAPDAPATSPGIGAAFAAVLVGESLLLVAIYRLAPTLPAWLRAIAVRAYKLVGAVLFLVGCLGVAWLFYHAPIGTSLALAGGVGAYSLARLCQAYDLLWLVHDAVAFAISIVFVAIAAHHVTPAPIVVFLALTLVWDHVAVTLSNLMRDLVDLSADLSIPNYYIVPSTPTLDYEAVTDWLGGDADRPEGVAAIIGVGDFVLPSLLIVSAVVHTSGVLALAGAVGVVVSLGALTAAMERAEGALPALPWVNSGAIVGYATGLVVMLA